MFYFGGGCSFKSDGAISLRQYAARGMYQSIGRVIAALPNDKIQYYGVSLTENYKYNSATAQVSIGLYDITYIFPTGLPYPDKYAYEKTYVLFDEDGVKALCKTVFEEVSKSLFDVKYAIPAKIQQKLLQIKLQQKHYPPVTIDGLTVTPLFEDRITMYMYHKALSAGEAALDEYLAKAAVPSGWACGDASSDTPEAAVRNLRCVAIKSYNRLLYPLLTGSPKQIAWAEDIRAQWAYLYPQSESLKTESSSAFWIANRATFPD